MGNDVPENTYGGVLDLEAARKEEQRLWRKSWMIVSARIISFPVTIVMLILLPLTPSIFVAIAFLMFNLAIRSYHNRVIRDVTTLSQKINLGGQEKLEWLLITNLDHVSQIFNILLGERIDVEDLTRDLTLLSEFWLANGCSDLSTNLEFLIQSLPSLCEEGGSIPKISEKVSNLAVLFVDHVLNSKDKKLS
jgi:hypothetical protein